MNNQKVVYQVTYRDDRHRTHMTFVKGFSAVRLLEERFTDVFFEKTEHYSSKEEELEMENKELLFLMF